MFFQEMSTRVSFLVLQELLFRSSHPEVFLVKGVLKICSKFTGKHPRRIAISIKLNIALRHGCSPVNLGHIFRTPFSKNTSGWLSLNFWKVIKNHSTFSLKQI